MNEKNEFDIKKSESDTSHPNRLTTFTKRHRFQIALAVIWAVILVGLISYLAEQDLTVRDIILFILGFISHPYWGPLIFIVAYTLRPLTFFSGAAMTIMAGVVFGFWYGLFYAFIGLNLSAILAYVLGRFFSGVLPDRNNSKVNKLYEQIRQKPFMSIITMHLLLMPYDFINYGAGILRISFTTYMIATVVGTILGTLMFISIGASISLETFINEGFSADIINLRFIGLSILIFLLSFLFSKLIKPQQIKSKT